MYINAQTANYTVYDASKFMYRNSFAITFFQTRGDISWK